ncbi:MAG: aldehyde dehydrogenase family protein [Pseudomonadota bacterium]
MHTFTHFIDGESYSDPGQKYFETDAPHTGKPSSKVALGDAQTVERSVQSNLAAYDEWHAMDPLSRGRILIDLGRNLRAAKDRLAAMETEQTGKTLAQAPVEIEAAAQYFEYYGGLTTLPRGDVIDNGPGFHAYTMHVPFGVVGVITPWNLPINQSARAIAPALAMGNVVTAKPSEFTSGTSVELAKIAIESGLPKGVLNVVLGQGADCGAALVSHPKVRKVCFTGSVRAGREIGHIAADKIIPLTLELGGKSANILFEDANLDDAIPVALAAFATNAGQVCTAGTRLLVQNSIRDEVVKRLVALAKDAKVGPGVDAATGAITTPDQLARVNSYFEIAKQDGATCELGGVPTDNGDGRYAPITIYSNVTPDMRIAQEEIFGPVLSIMSFDTEEDAIEIANGTDYGLAAALWTQDLGRAHRVAAAMEAGYTSVNHYSPSNFLPFGGFKDSGYGREKGIEALHHYCQTKSINIKL